MNTSPWTTTGNGRVFARLFFRDLGSEARMIHPSCSGKRDSMPSSDMARTALSSTNTCSSVKKASVMRLSYGKMDMPGVSVFSSYM